MQCRDKPRRSRGVYAVRILARQKSLSGWWRELKIAVLAQLNAGRSFETLRRIVQRHSGMKLLISCSSDPAIMSQTPIRMY